VQHELERVAQIVETERGETKDHVVAPGQQLDATE
jgi:hypothetical protein